MTQDAGILLDAGKHYLCTCGQTKNSPNCDGSHKGTDCLPFLLELETPQTVVISEVIKAA
ncbi:MAG: CDGSH iron-sulfur domain-containing protein [Leptolyngbyaceae bacterium]|nr:CDGSH iron-sulfur domain-containing protein [Leptolyngbyaceae bacterium]